MKVRLALPDDLPELERLKRSVPYPESFFWDEESYYARACERLRDGFSGQPELSDWRVLVLVDEGRAAGFLVLVLDEEHGVTHELQTRILDFAALTFEGLSALLAQARKIASAWENLYLIAELPMSDKRLQLWFYRAGFRAEQTRAVKRIPAGYRGASSPLYRIRKACSDDLPFILAVHAAHTAAYRPARRDIDLETLEFRYQMAYLGLDLDDQGGAFCYILEEASTQRSIGYILIQPGLGKSFYVYDAAIAPDFSGRGLSRYLIGAAETLAGQEGALLYGDGSLATPVIASWHAQMGYTVDSLRFSVSLQGNL